MSSRSLLSVLAGSMVGFFALSEDTILLGLPFITFRFHLAGGRGALADSFGSLDEHRMLAEKHLMTESLPTRADCNHTPLSH